MRMKTMKYVAVALALSVTSAAAQSDNTLRVRGTVTAIAADAITVQASSGQSVTVKLKPNYGVIQYVPIKITDVVANAYVAVASQPQADGSLKALSVVVFPEAMRGMGEGTKGWDLTAGSKMTNATAGNIAAKPDGRELTLTFKGETQKISVPETASITTFTKVDATALRVGSKIVAFAERAADGTISSGFVGTSKDGSLPPI